MYKIPFALINYIILIVYYLINKHLAIEIIKLTNSKSKISHMPLPSDDPINRVPDISKAINQLNWKPSVNRSEGLKKTIEYFSKELNVAF